MFVLEIQQIDSTKSSRFKTTDPKLGRVRMKTFQIFMMRKMKGFTWLQMELYLCFLCGKCWKNTLGWKEWIAKSRKGVTQCYWMRFVCMFLLNSSVSTLQFLRLSHLGISLNAPRKLSGCPFAEDMMKPWKSAEFLEVANLWSVFRIYPAEAAGENAEFFGCKIGTPKDSAEKRLFSNQLFCVTQNCFKEFM